jgi:hypothetical protein
MTSILFAPPPPAALAENKLGTSLKELHNRQEINMDQVVYHLTYDLVISFDQHTKQQSCESERKRQMRYSKGFAPSL